MKRILLWAAAAALLAFSVANLLAPDHDAGEYMLYSLTLGVFAYALFFRRAEAFFRRRGPRVARWALRVVLLFFATMIAFLTVMGNTDTATGAESVVIVLGAKLDGARPCKILRDRLNVSAAFLRRHARPSALLSGGQVPGEAMAEADAMRALLTEAGIDGARLWTETRSQNTNENFLFSRREMEARGLTAAAPIAIATSSFHCYRARRYAESAGFSDINILPCRANWADSPTWYLREVVATVYFWLTGR